MTCQFTTMGCTRPHAEAYPRLGYFARAAHGIRSAWRAYWVWRARKVAVMLLQSLDRRTLHDIGVSPSEIESLVRTGGDGRRRYDAEWLWRCSGR